MALIRFLSLCKKCILAGCILMININFALAANYFWIGNGGDWKDSSHWSLTSGGSTAGSIPTLNDNVFFDANSFTLAGQIVFILDDGSFIGVTFKTMDWRGVTNNPTFQIRRVTSDYVSNECYGSLYFSDNMTLDFDGAEFYMASSANYEFDTRGHNMGQNCWLWFNNTTPVTGNILSDINHAWIYFNQGIVNFNGHSFFGINNSNNVEQPNYPTIWLNNGTATLNISNSLIDVGAINFGNGSTLIDNNATLRIRNSFTASNHDFNYVVFDSVTMNGSALNNTFQNLEISPASVVKFVNTQTINNLIANGSRQNPIYISTPSPGIASTIQKSTGSIDIFWAHLKDIVATGGATFNAHGAWNDGNVTGWNFKLDALDREDLDALYISTNGANWINNAPWESSPADPRIVIDNGNPIASGGRVTSILLNDNNLTGTITGELPNLDSLTSVDVSGNALTGIFPTVLAELNLISLNLSNNQFTGAVPPLESTALSGLINLDLSNNLFDELPDMTIMPSLITLNVSGNNFDFEDLEKNQSIIVDDGVGFYQNQAPLASDPYEEIQAGQPHDLVLPQPAGGTPANNSYQWKFKPFFPAYGDTTIFANAPGISDQEIYAIDSVKRKSIGKYKVEIQNSLVPGLILSSDVFEVEALADISGALKFNDVNVQPSNRPTVFKEMKLLQVTSGGYDTIRAVSVDNGGNYLFNDVKLRDYLINGFADPLIAQYNKAVPTWYTQTIYWEEADTLVLLTDTANFDIVSAVRPDPPTTGQGNITGTFYEEIDDEGKIAVKNRVNGAAVTVRRVQQSGRGAAEILTLVDYKFTDENGEFSFTFLDENEYRLNLQYPGYPMDEESYITIPIVNNLFERQVAVEAEVVAGKIFVRKLIITGWEEKDHSMKAFPNPTVEYLFIPGKYDESLTFHMFNSQGAGMGVRSIWNEERKQCEIDVRELKPGVYILKAEQGNKTETLRVVVK